MKQGWAYAPFMSVIDNAWGPLDLVPAPLNQDVCPPAERTSSHKPFTNVTWHITYSGRTPFKLVYTNVLSNATAYNMTTTTEEKTLLQSQSAVRQGIIGNPYSDNYHPRRQAILNFLA
ncbi:hypothetical protein BJ165DRAFT_1485445 [Panaeolus papilionaceus]|nr:hypothetical protein BJ165DRAFT_1485445 [Panaeolus papilionaceus]